MLEQLKKKKKIIIIGGPGIDSSKIQYRRTRLMNFLSKHEEYKIFWIYSENKNLNSFGKIAAKEFVIGNSRVTSINVSDFFFLLSRGLFPNFAAKKILSYVGDISQDDVFIYTLPRFSLLGLLNKSCNVIYDISDNWVGQYKSKSLKSFFLKYFLNKSEKSIVSASKYIFASSSTIKDFYEEKYSCEIQLAQNGVDFDQISSAKRIELLDIKNKFKYIIGFSGSLLNRESNKIDFDLLNQIADHRPDCLMLLIGPYDNNPSKKIRLLHNKPNVFFLGLVDSSDIGGYIKNFDLALLPYLKNEFTSGIFPIKLYEYLACSIPVASVNLPAAQHIFDSSGFLIQSPNKSIFLDACDDLLNREMMPQDSNELLKLASEADWSITFNLIKNYIQL